MTRVAVISDTHGLVRPEILPHLRRAHRTLHAGDIDSPQILAALQAITPLTVIRGNVDKGAWAARLPLSESVSIEGALIHMVHNLADLDPDSLPAGCSAVVYGHSHQPKIERRGSVWFINPGSCGPKRFRLPVTMAMLEIESNGELSAELIELNV